MSVQEDEGKPLYAHSNLIRHTEALFICIYRRVQFENLFMPMKRMNKKQAYIDLTWHFLRDEGEI